MGVAPAATGLAGGLFDRGHVHGKVWLAPDLDHLGAFELGIKAVHAKGGRAVDDGIAGRQEEAAKVVEHLVGPVRGQDMVGGHADIARQRLAQFRLLRVRVDVVVVVLGQRFKHGRERAVRVFVGVELDDAVDGNAETLAQHLEGQDRRVFFKVGEFRTQQRARVKLAHGRLLYHATP